MPGSAKERVLMLYFNTNVGATLDRDGLRKPEKELALPPIAGGDWDCRGASRTGR